MWLEEFGGVVDYKRDVEVVEEALYTRGLEYKDNVKSPCTPRAKTFTIGVRTILVWAVLRQFRTWVKWIGCFYVWMCIRSKENRSEK